MSYHFLTSSRILSGRLYSLLEKITGKQKNVRLQSDNTYTLREIIKNDPSAPFKVGLFVNKKGQKVIIKTLSYVYKNSWYELILNEASILQVLNSYAPSGKIHLPKLVEFIESNNTIKVVREYIEGKKLSDYDFAFKQKVLTDCITFLAELSDAIPDEIKKEIPKRTKSQIVMLFPYYFLRSLLKNPFAFRTYFSLFIIFYKNISLKKATYMIAHKDLTSENILIKNGKPSIIDFETTNFGPKYTELALVARYFCREFDQKTLLRIIKSYLKDQSAVSDFIYLTIFYTFYFMTIESTGGFFYKEALEYIDILKDGILPSILSQKKGHIKTVSN